MKKVAIRIYECIRMLRIKFGWAHSDTPSRRRGLRYSHAGFTLLEILLVVAAIAILAGIVIIAIIRLNN